MLFRSVEEGPRCRQKRRPRRFEEKWATHPNCEAITQNAWRQVTPAASPMFVLCEKIKVCRETLFKWRRETFGREDQQLQARMLQLESLSNANSMGQHS